MIIIWYTQPIGGFSSFYYYDKVARILVRIRLELNRKKTDHDNGEAMAIYRINRYCAFSRNPELLETSKLSVLNGVVVASKDNDLSDVPKDGYYVYDFSSKDGKNPDRRPHNGNVVTSKPLLPDGITEMHLKLLAQKCIALKSGIVLVPRNASEAQLKQAILDAIK